MNEVEVFEPQESNLLAWARDAAEAFKIAQSLAKTSFVSTTMRGKPEEITAAILTGAEVGLQPMSSLRSIDIISGTPAMRANTMRGLVQSQGHSIRLVESTAARAVVAGHRKGETADDDQKSVWTLDRARQLGVASKDNWQKQPQAMLVARATAECCRLVASDVLLGLPYAAEELEDVDPEAPKPVRRTAKRAPVAVPDLPLEEPAAIEAVHIDVAEPELDEGAA